MNINIEVGSGYYFSNFNNQDYIRRDLSEYTTDCYFDNHDLLSTNMYKVSYAIKPEIYLVGQKLSLITGLRYTRYSVDTDNDDFWDVGESFYVRVPGKGLNTDYYRVRNIDQDAHYLGIPLEVKFSPSGPRAFRMHLKLGAEVGYLIYSYTDVRFKNSSMRRYIDSVRDVIGEPRKVNAAAYAAVGFRAGREHRPGFLFELTLPTFYLTKDQNLLAEPLWGFGIQLGMSIPLNKE